MIKQTQLNGTHEANGQSADLCASYLKAVLGKTESSQEVGNVRL